MSVVNDFVNGIASYFFDDQRNKDEQEKMQKLQEIQQQQRQNNVSFQTADPSAQSSFTSNSKTTTLKDLQMNSSLDASGAQLRDDQGRVQMPNADPAVAGKDQMVGSTWQSLYDQNRPEAQGIPPLQAHVDTSNIPKVGMNLPDPRTPDEKAQDALDEGGTGKYPSPFVDYKSTTQKLIDSLAAGVNDLKSGVKSAASDVVSQLTQGGAAFQSGLEDIRKTSKDFGATRGDDQHGLTLGNAAESATNVGKDLLFGTPEQQQEKKQLYEDTAPIYKKVTGKDISEDSFNSSLSMGTAYAQLSQWKKDPKIWDSLSDKEKATITNVAKTSMDNTLNLVMGVSGGEGGGGKGMADAMKKEAGQVVDEVGTKAATTLDELIHPKQAELPLVSDNPLLAAEKPPIETPAIGQDMNVPTKPETPQSELPGQVTDQVSDQVPPPSLDMPKDPYANELKDLQAVKPVYDAGEMTPKEAQDFKQKWDEAVNSGAISPENAKPEIPPGQKERKFIETVRESDTTAPEVAAGVEGSHTPITNQATLDAAHARVASNLDDAVAFAKSEGVADAEKTATQQVLMQKFQNEGNYQSAIDMAETAATQATSQGQAIQALSMWGRLTPEGALKYAARQLQKANVGKAAGKTASLSEEDAAAITDLAKAANEAPEGREKAVAASKLLDKIDEITPSNKVSGALKWVSGVQTMAQLLNPKTAIRNILGNLGFAGLENLKDVVATPLDMATSLATGNRTKALPSLIEQGKGFGEGLKAGFLDAIQGVDTSASKASGTNKFDTPTKNFTDPILGNLEKLLNVELKTPDRAFYTAAFNDSLRQQMKLAKVEEPTGEMLATAHADGLYRTFQDPNAASTAFSKIKSGLNGGKGWGLGDLVIKYPATPGSLLMKTIDYSPVGFVKTVGELVKPLITGKPFNQKQFVETAARGITGSTTLIGTGMILQRLGVITGKPDVDSDIKTLQQQQGLGDYRLNASALKRLFVSGFSPDAAKPEKGDTIVSFDWFQPQAVNIAMGADIAAHRGDPRSAVGTLVTSLAAGANTLVEQPLVSGLNNLFAYGNPAEGVLNAIKGAPASMVPTILNQVRQLTDNTAREVQDPNPLKESLNLIQNKIPGLDKGLPPQIKTTGGVKDNYQDGSNNLFNVFLNPSFVSHLKTDPIGDEVLRLFDQTGEAGQAPRKVKNSESINGKTTELTGQQKAQLQQYVGSITETEFQKVMDTYHYQHANDEDKTKILANIISDVFQAGKIELLGHEVKKPSSDVKRIMRGENPQLPLTAP